MIAVRLAAILPLVLLACAPAPVSPPAPPPPEAPARAASAAPSEAPPPPLAAPAAPSPPLPPAVAPLTQAEQKETERTCKPLLNALAQRKKPGSGVTPLDLLEQVLVKPPPAMSKPDVARCAELMRRGIATYLQAAIEMEARVTTRQIAMSMAAAYEREQGGDGGPVVHALCPSAQPVPADLAAVRGKAHVAAESDWSGPGWACLHFQLGGNQRFQYEVKTDPAARTFLVIGRQPSADGTRVVEISQPGRVTDAGAVELGPPARVERAP
jgi:hypothetical protein